MSFQESIRVCFSKYADFTGRASPAEFWWFILFLFVAGIATSFISSSLGILFNLGTLLPALAVGARRLHDTNRSGWLQLLCLLPIVGIIVLIIFWAQESKS